MTPEDLHAAARQLVERTRTAQGLPRHVEDPSTLHTVARILVGAERGTARAYTSPDRSNSTRSRARQSEVNDAS